jgi:hypothetical protein
MQLAHGLPGRCLFVCYGRHAAGVAVADAAVFNSPSALFTAGLQVPLYALNQHLCFKTLQALDMGGSITIHAFGAYYGLAASLVLSNKRQAFGAYTSANPKNSASYISDLFSIIGTLFLWMFVSTCCVTHDRRYEIQQHSAVCRQSGMQRQCINRALASIAATAGVCHVFSSTLVSAVLLHRAIAFCVSAVTILQRRPGALQ